MEDDPSKASAATSPEQHCTSCDNTALPESLWLNTVADVPLHFPGHEASDRSIGFLRRWLSGSRLLVASQWEESCSCPTTVPLILLRGKRISSPN